jgi:hypothetical protein
VRTTRQRPCREVAVGGPVDGLPEPRIVDASTPWALAICGVALRICSRFSAGALSRGLRCGPGLIGVAGYQFPSVPESKCYCYIASLRVKYAV